MENSSKHERVQLPALSAAGAGQNAPRTMSTREIAELCEKEHRHVLRDARKMLEALSLDDKGYAHFWAHPQNGQKYEELLLPRDLTMTLVTGYSIPLRKKVIDRLDELEQRVADPSAIFSDPVAMRGLLLTYTEKVIALESCVERMQGDVAALEKIADSHGSFNRTEAAKNLGVPPRVLIRWLATHGWTYRRPGTTEDLAYQSKMAAGYLEHKIKTGPKPDGSEWVSTQVRVTARGLTVLAKAFPKSARLI
ncbi:MAG: phage regulatory protein/antirepressor Ant [Proteobacteria bacterium]|nr:phage regulatory protein/antirepressor Ant [Pseudomonadota bacterium]